MERRPMKRMAEILSTIGASSHDVENWTRTLHLSTKFQPTISGRARLFSRDNVLELAFLAAFTRAGAKPATCVAFAAAMVRDATNQIGGPFEWLAFTAGDLNSATPFDDFSPKAFAKIAKKLSPAVIALVAVGETVRRVNALFEVD
jgi:hypothetical protein